MAANNSNVQSATTCISALQLKQVLITLTKIDNICFRYRLVGEMWSKYHMRVDSIIDTNKVLLYSEPEQKHFLVRLNSIIQFDLDHPFQFIAPHIHISVTPSPELENEDYLLL